MGRSVLFNIILFTAWFSLNHAYTAPAHSEADSFWQLAIDQQEELYTDYNEREPFGNNESINTLADELPGDNDNPGEPGKTAPVGDGIIILFSMLAIYTFFKKKKTEKL